MNGSHYIERYRKCGASVSTAALALFLVCNAQAQIEYCDEAWEHCLPSSAPVATPHSSGGGLFSASDDKKPYPYDFPYKEVYTASSDSQIADADEDATPSLGPLFYNNSFIPHYSVADTSFSAASPADADAAGKMASVAQASGEERQGAKGQPVSPDHNSGRLTDMGRLPSLEGKTRTLAKSSFPRFFSWNKGWLKENLVPFFRPHFSAAAGASGKPTERVAANAKQAVLLPWKKAGYVQAVVKQPVAVPRITTAVQNVPAHPVQKVAYRDLPWLKKPPTKPMPAPETPAVALGTAAPSQKQPAQAAASQHSPLVIAANAPLPWLAHKAAIPDKPEAIAGDAAKPAFHQAATVPAAYTVAGVPSSLADTIVATHTLPMPGTAPLPPTGAAANASTPLDSGRYVFAVKTGGVANMAALSPASGSASAPAQASAQNSSSALLTLPTQTGTPPAASAAPLPTMPSLPSFPALPAPVTPTPVTSAPATPAAITSAPLSPPVMTSAPMQPFTVPAATPLPGVSPRHGISAESRHIVEALPPEVTEQQQKPHPVSVKHFRNNAMESDDEVKKHDGVGITITVQRPKEDISQMLENAYNALIAGNQEEAIGIYKDVLAQQPKNKLALFGLATTYHRSGQLQMARPLYGRLLAIDPSNVEGLNNFLVLLADESPKEALVELERLERNHPGFSPIPAQMAIIYEKLHNYPMAVHKMQEAIDISPENIKYQYDMAVIFDRRGDWADAATLYQQLLVASERGEKIPSTAEEIQERLTFIRSNSPKE